MGDIVDLNPVATRWGHRLATLAGSARHEVLAFHPDLADVALLVGRVEAAVGRQVAVRHIVPAGVAAPAGREVRRRVVNAPQAGLFVFDHERALVLTAGQRAEGVVLSDRGSVCLLWTFFERLWAEASSYDWATGGLSDQEVTTVRLLADGHTDMAIATRLGVSERTARRIVSRLMDMLGARGRFQAGVRAVEAGWLANRPFDVRTTG